MSKLKHEYKICITDKSVCLGNSQHKQYINKKIKACGFIFMIKSNVYYGRSGVP